MDYWIPKKAHLNDRTLREEIVPAGVRVIEDWAYAGCKNLTKVSLPDTIESVSSKAFAGCEALREIHIYPASDGVAGDPDKQISHLLALSVRAWPAGTQELIRKAIEAEKEEDCGIFQDPFDALLSAYLEEPDDAGFAPFLAGGEEDYDGEENDVDAFVQKKREEKVHLIYERMRIFPDHAEWMLAFLKKHRCGAAFTFLLREEPYMRQYRDLFFRLRIPEAEDVQTLLSLCAEDGELRSRVLGIRAQAGPDTDPFDALGL